MLTADNKIAVSSFTVQSADMGITITVDKATPNENDTVTYTITLTNNGPINATGVIVYDALPEDVTYVSSTADQGSYDTSSGNWTVGNVDNGASIKLTIKVTVNSETGAFAIDNGTQIIYTDQPDSNLNNNIATASITVNGAELEITKSVDTVTPGEGDTVTYYITVTNNGPLKATGVAVKTFYPKA